ncbi:MAG: hypothetical protein AAF651_10040 [Cyanobacteria bacterium P01_C01_bin.73]
MTNHNLHNYLYPKATYHGQVTPAHLAFNDHLQEFSQRVSYIANLQTAGKLSAEEAFQRVQTLWTRLSQTSQTLKLDPRDA